MTLTCVQVSKLFDRLSHGVAVGTVDMLNTTGVSKDKPIGLLEGIRRSSM